MDSQLTIRYIPADFLTASHYIFGQLKVTHSGIMGMLSDVTTSNVEINDASVARIQNSDQIINYAPLIWLVKHQIIAVCLSKREYAGIQALYRSNVVRSQQYAVQITTPTYEVSGTLEWSGRFEFSVLMTDGTNNFLLLQDAALTAILYPSLHIESPMILLNRSFIDSLVILRNPSPDK